MDRSIPSSYHVVGQVTVSATCIRCGQYVVEAGGYWEWNPATPEQIAEGRKTYICPECHIERRRKGQTVEQFIKETPDS